MSEMVMNATALPQIFFELYPEGQVRVRIDGKTMTLQPAEEQTQEFPLIGMFAHLSSGKSGSATLPSEEFARRKREEKELER